MKKTIIFLGIIISLTLLTVLGRGETVMTGDAVSVWVTYAPPIILNITSSLQNSTTFILNVTTNEDSYCRYSNQSVGYDYMTDQFTNGEGSTLHWTNVSAQEGVNIFYTSCGDTSGSNMTNATPIMFIPLEQWWNSFSLKRIILENFSSLAGNYTVPNVLTSIAGNYQILYYYNSTSWTSYAPARPAGLNDLAVFNDQSNLPYWIYMTVVDRIEIK